MTVKDKNIKSAKDEAEIKKPLQFMVDESFHREFKAYAANKGIKMSDLFKEMYGLYRNAKG